MSPADVWGSITFNFASTVHARADLKGSKFQLWYLLRVAGGDYLVGVVANVDLTFVLNFLFVVGVIFSGPPHLQLSMNPVMSPVSLSSFLSFAFCRIMGGSFSSLAGCLLFFIYKGIDGVLRRIYTDHGSRYCVERRRDNDEGHPGWASRNTGNILGSCDFILLISGNFTNVGRRDR